MEDKKKYKVKVGDPFGGYWTAGENLTLEEAKVLCIKENSEADYFTSAHVEDEVGKQIY